MTTCLSGSGKAGQMPKGSKPPAQASTRRSSLMQVAHAEILRRILTLELAPGVAFTEGELAEQLGLSKTPVREALLLIGAEGLVYPQIGAGYRVSPITLKGARDLLRHRGALDALACRFAAEIGMASREVAMFSNLLDFDLLRGADDGHRVRRNASFHCVLAELTRNEELASDVRRAHLKLERLFRLVHATASSSPEEEAHEHEEILHAIQMGDASSARALAEAHAARTEKRVMEALISRDTLQGVNLA